MGRNNSRGGGSNPPSVVYTLKGGKKMNEIDEMLILHELENGRPSKVLYVRPRNIIWMRWSEERHETNIGIGGSLATVVIESPDDIRQMTNELKAKNMGWTTKSRDTMPTNNDSFAPRTEYWK